MKSSSSPNSSVLRYFQSLLTFAFVSLCLFFFSIISYIVLRKFLLPISHLTVPMPLGLPISDKNRIDSSSHWPSSLVSYVNLTDRWDHPYPLDLFKHSYRIELECHAPRSYRNRQLGSFFVHLMFFSSSNQLIIEHSRLILFPYQSEIVRLTRTILSLPLALINWHVDQWSFNEILLDYFQSKDKSNRYLEQIRLIISPSSFQIDRCEIDFQVLDLSGLTYALVYHPILAGVLFILFLFSIYMSFYLTLIALSLINTRNNKIDSPIKEE